MPQTTPPHTEGTDEVLEKVRHAESAGYCVFTVHARDRMRERNARAADVRNAIRTATSARRRENGSWKLTGGKDIDGDDLDFAVDISGDSVRIVTIFG